MNTTTRRIATAVAGLALAGSAVAATGPAAFAGKPGKVTPITIVGGGQSHPDGSVSLDVSYAVPVASTAITSVSCTLDGVPLSDCGSIIGNSAKVTNYWGIVIRETEHPEHVFTLTVTTKKATYGGSQTLQWIW